MKKLFLLAAAVALAAVLALSGSDRAAVGVAGGPRVVANINAGWQYAPVDNGVTGEWQAVDLPHTWNAKDTLDGDTKYRKGVGLYKKERDLTPEPQKRYYLRFEGANIKSWVSVNGKPAGEHKGGYTAFAYEITSLLQPGKNLVEVKVDNSWDTDIMPLYCDYNFYGGIYRSVWLIETGPAAIAITDYASPGVYLSQKKITPEKAELEFLARISAPTAAGLFVRFTVLDAAGDRVTQVEATPTAAGDWLEARAPVVIDSPHLWNGTADPYQYRVRTELLIGKDTLDAIDQPLGLRFYSVDKDKGFSLNGKTYRMHGVCRHQDRDGKGNAISAEDQEQDFALMAEMGVNTVRLSHYPQAELAYSICDRRGITVWAELPFIGMTGDATGVFLNNPRFRDILKQQLVELVRQNYNHPSIIVWGLFNELSPPGDPVPLLKELNALAHQEDPYRLTTAATHHEGALNDVTDLICWNKYNGWYYWNADNFTRWVDQQHRDFPDRCLCMSEYGAGASVHQHSELNYHVNPQGHWHPENYQAYVHEVHWAAISQRPWLWSSFLWNMFDFGVVKRNEGDRPNINDKGMVSFDRKTKKDVFFFYKANWNPEPMIYITNRRFVERKSPIIEAKVYCNAGPVTLTVNGIPVKMKSKGYSIYTADLALKPGSNQVKATAGALTDEVVWKFLAP